MYMDLYFSSYFLKKGRNAIWWNQIYDGIDGTGAELKINGENEHSSRNLVISSSSH